MALLPSQRSEMTEMRVSEELVIHLAAAAGIEITPEHMPGVIRSMEVLLAQIDLLFDTPTDPLVEPAPVFRP